MGAFSAVDWSTLFIPDRPLLEIITRGTVVYLSLFLMLKLVQKRQQGEVDMPDILVIVLIADASQNALGGDYRSIPDGLLLVAVILFWAFALDWLSFKFRFLERLLRPPPLPLIEDGEMNRQNMRKELISRDELESMLREAGIEDPTTVRRAYLEHTGRLSIIQ